ncbi:hypothetical protein [Mycobacterium sp.]|uniref:hypothetical protein n=1 Tax=Mycobacterium sp. TaxID=1785 RepID=UPI0025D6B03D|nr:hypothetical protein [Mycobacterium sp.]
MPTALSTFARRVRPVRRLPSRVKVGIVVAVVAVAGLAWEHHGHSERAATPVAPPSASAPAPGPESTSGDYGDQPSQEQLPPPTVAPQAASMDAAHAVAQRFASNFGTPNNNRDDWLTRIDADVSTQLREQYQLTDIRNVNQAAVTGLVGPLDVLPGAVAFRATYSDDSQIQMHLELSLDGWKVVNVVPVRAGSLAAPAAPEVR